MKPTQPTTPTPRKPEPSAQVAARKSKQRAANRTWLRSQGWTKDAEALVTAARRGEVRITIEIVEKGNSDEKNQNT